MSRPTDWAVLGLDGDPTPGDPFAVRELARRLLEFAADVEHTRSQVSTLVTSGTVESWLGRAGDAFRDELDAFPGQLQRLEMSYRMAGNALNAYEPVLAAAQTQADRALVRGRDARALRDQAQLAVSPEQVTLATASLTVTDLTPASYAHTAEIPPPDPDQLAQAIRNQQAAQTRLDQARHSAQNAQDDLDAARRLALAAKQIREDAAATCAAAIRTASHAGIRNRPWWSWDRLKEHAGTVWHTAVEVAKITVTVLGVIALVIGGPIAWVVLAAALIVLADALVRYDRGQAGLWDVGFALLDCIPGTRGLTTLGNLTHGLRTAGQALRDGRALTTIARGGTALTRRAITTACAHLTTTATNLRGARTYTTTLVKSLLPHTGAVTPDGHLLMVGGDSLSNAHHTAKDALNEARGTDIGTDTAPSMIFKSSKYDYLFGRVSSDSHNRARSNQIAFSMKHLGISDDTRGRKLLEDHFREVVADRDNIVKRFENQYGNFEVRDSLLVGPSGKFAHFETTWQILPNGSRSFSTLIPRWGG
ncbi:putative T7SS-secreted protein [Frankia sp. Cas4]|uniref:putative T7SS-secreted protein n=1 Tax=Frankia sp. Cas4 TaxID=3073927 RepID=UPI002AD22A93|nr:hypothetical protein [Frankia sp. Cas4]